MRRAQQLSINVTSLKIINTILGKFLKTKEERRQKYLMFFTALIVRAKFRRTIQMKGRQRIQRNQRTVKQALNFLSVIKAAPLMPKVHKLFRTFIERSSVVLGRKSAIVGYINKVITLQRKFLGRLNMKRTKKRALLDFINGFIDW